MPAAEQEGKGKGKSIWMGDGAGLQTLSAGDRSLKEKAFNSKE